MRNTCFLAAAFLLGVAPAAHADSIQLTVNCSVLANISSPNDNFWGEYTTSRPQSIDLPSLGPASVTASFSSVSLFIPAGDVVTSATIDIVVPSTEIQGAGNIFIEKFISPPDPGGAPSKAPGLGGPDISEVHASYESHLLSPLINGDIISTGDLNLVFDLQGYIEGSVVDPGVNWDGYIGGSGQVDIPYTVQLDVTYSPVPEPSTLALLGTGLLGPIGAVRRKFLPHP